MSKVVDRVSELLEALFVQEGFELVDIEYVKEGKSWFLRLAIDKENGVDLNDCAYMSEKIGEVLDTADPDPIPQAYYLEVMSPGAERPLKTKEAIQQSLGQYVHFSFYREIKGMKFVEGELKEASDNELTLAYLDKTQEKLLKLTYEDIAKARLAIKF